MRKRSIGCQMSLRSLAGRIALLPLALLLLPTAVVRAEGCPNEQARAQNRSIHLLDCRAYELVSPLNKNGGDIAEIDRANNGGVVQATPDGEKLTYVSFSSFGDEAEGAPVGSQYLSARTSEGWNTKNVTLRLETPSHLKNLGTPYKAFSTDLTRGLMPYDELANPPLGGAPAGYNNYYLRGLDDNSVSALFTNPPIPSTAFGFFLEGAAATPDLKHIVLNSEAALTPGALAGEGSFDWNLYEVSDGVFHVANVLPGVTNGATATVETRLAGLSDDGSRVIFSTAPGGAGSVGTGLYVRENVAAPQSPIGEGGACTVPTDACTVQVDAAIGGNGRFLAAGADASDVFFTQGTNGTGDLYRYALDSNTLTDLTPTENPGEARVRGVLGASDDGSYIYFVAAGAFAPGAAPEECEPASTTTGCNLYALHTASGGAPVLTFVARLSSGDEGFLEEGFPDAHDWGTFSERTARVSSDGRHVVFMSEASLTGYNNNGSHCVPEINENGLLVGFGVGKCQQVYTYEFGTSAPICVSCNPDSAAPAGPSSIPGATDYSGGQAMYQSRVVSGDGSRIFFNSSDALLASDTNSEQDVYEWEKANTNSCTEAGGCLGLISGGLSSEGSAFLDAGADGSNVFFATRQQLAGADTDQEVDVYDARENGGYAHVAPTACSGTACQGLPAETPIFATPATATFNGVGNLLPPVPTKPKPPKRLTAAQKLAKALKACTKKPKKQRAACVKRAHKAYPTPKKSRKK